ncbi:MAG: cytochrome c biogenesis protein CcsA [Syntrophothermus sp.]|nr:cytochrome c biogenesis protein CcsA [Syntrophothermus sp.]
MILYFWYATGRQMAWKAGRIATGLGWTTNTVALIARSVLTGRLPLATGYEFLLAFAWGIVLFYLIFELRTAVKAAGGFVLAFAWGLLAFIWVVMPEQPNAVAPLMPALKSGWLTVHVLTAVVAYSAFALACGLSVLYLWRYRDDGVKEGEALLDELIYKVVAFGFMMLSLTIVTGAVWAEKAWGSYWSWDPKETWSLVTWIIFGIYLHIRKYRNWRGRPAAILVVVGFLAVLFTFFGVNYLLPGMHSYA